MARVCPQRIIKEAIRLLELAHDGGMNEDLEIVENNILELEGLEKALYRDGIINIDEFNPCAEQRILRKQPWETVDDDRKEVESIQRG